MWIYEIVKKIIKKDNFMIEEGNLLKDINGLSIRLDKKTKNLIEKEHNIFYSVETLKGKKEKQKQKNINKLNTLVINKILVNESSLVKMNLLISCLKPKEIATWRDINNNNVDFTKEKLKILYTKGIKLWQKTYFDNITLLNNIK